MCWVDFWYIMVCEQCVTQELFYLLFSVRLLIFALYCILLDAQIKLHGFLPSICWPDHVSTLWRREGNGRTFALNGHQNVSVTSVTWLTSQMCSRTMRTWWNFSSEPPALLPHIGTAWLACHNNNNNNKTHTFGCSNHILSKKCRI